jgi:hypothetical protein
MGESLVPSFFCVARWLGPATAASALADGPGLFDLGFLGVLKRGI